MGTRRDDPKAYMASYRSANRERLREQNRASKKRCKLAKPEKYREQGRERNARWRANNPGYQAAWRAENKDGIRERRRIYERDKYATCTITRLTTRLRNRFNETLSGARKGASVLNLIGCSVAELRTHLEERFSDGMSWENHGAWHIDHQVPLCSVDPTADRAAWDRLWHHSNLRPLWASENCSAGAKAMPRPRVTREPGGASRRKRGAEPMRPRLVSTDPAHGLPPPNAAFARATREAA